MKIPVDWRLFLRSLSVGLAGIVGLCLLFAWIDSALPSIRPGADAVYLAKAHAISGGTLFQREAPVKVVIFGNSQVLTGFQPDLFDSLSGGKVSSYNLGLPGYLLFIANLEKMCRRGERPTHVLMMFPWQDEPDKTFKFLKPNIEDNRVMEELLPFRKLPRNLLLFAIRSKGHGGPVAYYDECRRQTEAMLAQKGYYFIEGQSHYQGHRLPDDFRLQGDNRGKTFLRSPSTTGPAFQRLTTLMERYDIRVIFVPRYFREGEVASPEPETALTTSLAQYPRFSVQGPAYWLMPNRCFSDPVHLNGDGAADYTRRLWELIGPSLVVAGRVSSAQGQEPAIAR